MVQRARTRDASSLATSILVMNLIDRLKAKRILSSREVRGLLTQSIDDLARMGDTIITVKDAITFLTAHLDENIQKS